MGQRVELTVPASDDGARVDAWLGRSVPALSRRSAKALVKQGEVRVNGARVVASHTLRANDRIELVLPTREGEPPRVPVLREGPDYLYLHKPAGLHTVRLRPDDPPTLADAAAAFDAGCTDASDDPREAGALHRLDFGTSGVVAFARTAEAWASGRAALSTSWKLYLARAESAPAHWPPSDGAYVRQHLEPPRWPEAASLPRPDQAGVETTWPLLGSGARGHRVRVDPEGQAAASRIWRVGPRLFAVELQSGRRHQIRVHMAELGLALEGDPLYGSGPDSAQSLLHAWAFQLGPPEPVVVAPPPSWATG